MMAAFYYHGLFAHLQPEEGFHSPHQSYFPFEKCDPRLSCFRRRQSTLHFQYGEKERRQKAELIVSSLTRDPILLSSAFVWFLLLHFPELWLCTFTALFTPLALSVPFESNGRKDNPGSRDPDAVVEHHHHGFYSTSQTCLMHVMSCRSQPPHVISHNPVLFCWLTYQWYQTAIISSDWTFFERKSFVYQIYVFNITKLDDIEFRVDAE